MIQIDQYKFTNYDLIDIDYKDINFDSNESTFEVIIRQLEGNFIISGITNETEITPDIIKFINRYGARVVGTQYISLKVFENHLMFPNFDFVIISLQDFQESPEKITKDLKSNGRQGLPDGLTEIWFTGFLGTDYKFLNYLEEFTIKMVTSYGGYLGKFIELCLEKEVSLNILDVDYIPEGKLNFNCHSYKTLENSYYESSYSVYGTTVDKKSRLSCIAIGGCTTDKSHEYIIECTDLVRQGVLTTVNGLRM